MDERIRDSPRPRVHPLVPQVGRYISTYCAFKYQARSDDLGVKGRNFQPSLRSFALVILK